MKKEFYVGDLINNVWQNKLQYISGIDNGVVFLTLLKSKYKVSNIPEIWRINLIESGILHKDMIHYPVKSGKE
jgi:hypothetical protein